MWKNESGGVPRDNQDFDIPGSTVGYSTLIWSIRRNSSGAALSSSDRPSNASRWACTSPPWAQDGFRDQGGPAMMQEWADYLDRLRRNTEPEANVPESFRKR